MFTYNSRRNVISSQECMFVYTTYFLDGIGVGSSRRRFDLVDGEYKFTYITLMCNHKPILEEHKEDLPDKLLEFTFRHHLDLND